MNTYNAICDNIFELYSYSNALKIIHYTTEKYSHHKLADDIRGDIIDFCDDFLEGFFGINGKPKYKSLSLDKKNKKFKSLRELCKAVFEKTDALYYLVKQEKKNKAMIPLIDDFVIKMEKNAFLVTFDELKGE